MCFLCAVFCFWFLCVCFCCYGCLFLVFFVLFTQRFKSPYTGKMCTNSLRKTSVDAACVCQANSEAVSVSLYLCGCSVQPSFLPRHIYIYIYINKIKSTHDIYGAYYLWKSFIGSVLVFLFSFTHGRERRPPPPIRTTPTTATIHQKAICFPWLAKDVSIPAYPRTRSSHSSSSMLLSVRAKLLLGCKSDTSNIYIYHVCGIRLSMHATRYNIYVGFTSSDASNKIVCKVFM